MKSRTERSKEIREFILSNVPAHPGDIAQLTAKHFGISRQSVAWHLKALVSEELLTATGKTRAREYKLAGSNELTFTLEISSKLEEDVVWRERVLPLLDGIPQNVVNICQYGFTEMFNNVLSHAEAKSVKVQVNRTAQNILMLVVDDGIGIFKRIQQGFDLHDPRHALLELSKGKITSDQAHHTGEGIFFTSRMFDSFTIMSDELFYSRTNQDDGWLIETEERNRIEGTAVVMSISSKSERSMQQVFNEFASEGNYDFSKTHVPIKLARYGTEQLVSRSQARRVLARFDRFSEVILDFDDVEMIGRAFADEIFRVYQADNPDTEIFPLNATPEVKNVIEKVKESGSPRH